MMKRYGFFISVVILFFFSSCAAPPKEISTQLRPDLSVEEQKERAMEKFNDILVASQSSKDRNVVLPRMEKLYTELIDEYPDAPIAQESYWKLIEMYVTKHYPAKYDKAEEIYYRFIKDYPASPFKPLVDRTLSVRYYKDKQWERLLKLSRPLFRSYVEDVKNTIPFLIFSYAESNFWLRNYDEAEKGFKVVVDNFPNFTELRLSKARLTYIQRKK
jgi:tetratricopeptide (TPR) repeat protein